MTAPESFDRNPGPYIEFWVYGTPAPQGSRKPMISPKGKPYHIESSGKTLKPWRQDIARTAMAARTAHGFSLVDEGAVELHVRFELPRPKALRKRPSQLDDAAKRPDVDKLLRGLMDAIKGVLYADDSQVVSVYAQKRVAEPGQPPGVFVRISRAS